MYDKGHVMFMECELKEVKYDRKLFLAYWEKFQNIWIKFNGKNSIFYWFLRHEFFIKFLELKFKIHFAH